MQDAVDSMAKESSSGLKTSHFRTCPRELVELLFFALIFGHSLYRVLTQCLRHPSLRRCICELIVVKAKYLCSHPQRATRTSKTCNSNNNPHNGQPFLGGLITCNISSRSHTVTCIVQCFTFEFSVLGTICSIIKAQQKHINIDDCFIDN